MFCLHWYRPVNISSLVAGWSYLGCESPSVLLCVIFIACVFNGTLMRVWAVHGPYFGAIFGPSPVRVQNVYCVWSLFGRVWPVLGQWLVHVVSVSVRRPAITAPGLCPSRCRRAGRRGGWGWRAGPPAEAAVIDRSTGAETAGLPVLLPIRPAITTRLPESRVGQHETHRGERSDGMKTSRDEGRGTETETELETADEDEMCCHKK